jgi:uncharacterized protein (DUF1697 family)
MRYVALLRGINVGSSVRISMKDLAELFTLQGYTHVQTYINSGNVVFDGVEESESESICNTLELALQSRYNQEIKTLVLEASQIKEIEDAIPQEWQNDETHKTDVAYLFPTIDSPEILDILPVKKEFLDLMYVPGAVIWRIDRKFYGKSQINKLVAHAAYQEMTVRNVNTARKLASIV